MSYTPAPWQNGGPPRTNPPDLNKLEQGVADAHASPENRSDGEHLYPGVYRPAGCYATIDRPAEAPLDYRKASDYGAFVREECDKVRYPRFSRSRQSAKSLQKANRPSSAKRKTSRDSSYRNSERPFSPNHSSRSQRSSARRRGGPPGRRPVCRRGGGP